jgi:hypothetical protein
LYSIKIIEHCNECGKYIETREYTETGFRSLREDNFKNRYCDDECRAFHTDREWLIAAKWKNSCIQIGKFNEESEKDSDE